MTGHSGLHLQPFLPEPPTVEGNVTTHRHQVRATFHRNVLALHLGWIAVGFSAFYLAPDVDTKRAWWAALAGVSALALVRAVRPNPRLGAALDSVLVGFVVVALGVATRALAGSGVPVWAFPVAASLAGLYNALCGRDFSHLGLFVLASGAGWAVAMVAWALGQVSGPAAAWAALTMTGYLGYLAYDLAMIGRRRRPDEVFSAAADLLRDPLNFGPYLVQVWVHWRRIRFV